MLTGFILAGGKSSRIGSDKAFLTLGGRTLIEAVIQRLRPQVDRLMVVASAQNYARLGSLLLDKVIVDIAPDKGPLMGIYTALMATETPLNLFVSCDMLWIDKNLVHSLMKRFIENSGEGLQAVASLHPSEGIQPFPLLCHASACSTIGALLGRGEKSLKPLFVYPHTQLVLVEEPDLWRSFSSVNTWEDYVRLRDNPLASY